jgi:antitoxin component HigA of HigAB toxin-antitoxin module
MPEIKPICTEKDYDAALSEVERLWGAKLGTREGDRLDVLATLIDSYEQVHCRRRERSASPIHIVRWGVRLGSVP